jgi:hypothetical protein
MDPLTLLDYEIFDHLKAVLFPYSSEVDPAFTEGVLGYGFQSDESNSPSFVLLCHPQTAQRLQALITANLPENGLDVGGRLIRVEVFDSIGPLTLSHSLTLESADKSDLQDLDFANWIQVSLGQTMRQVVLQEHRKIILPTYLLRYTPFTSPNIIILRAALNQIHYLHQSGRKGEDEFEQRTVAARMSEITRWSSFSRTSIYRLLHEDPHSAWLVKVENRGAFQNEQGQQISLPNQYLLEPLKLTPGDTTDFVNYLLEHQTEWENLDECLVSLAKMEKREVLSYPYRIPHEDDRSEPASVMSILQEVFGPFELIAERLTLIDKIRDHLIGDDFVAVPWYLLRKLLPLYGSSIITLYMMCQPLLYKNNGVHRDTFWLSGGDQTLVDWTGDHSIGKYFPKANPKGRGRPASAKGSSDKAWRKNKREMLSDFFLRIATRRDDEDGLLQWQIQVQDMPVLLQDENLMASLYKQLAELVSAGQLGNLIALLDLANQGQRSSSSNSILDNIYRTHASPQMIQALSLLANNIISDFETSEGKLISDFETPASRLISLFETPDIELFSESATSAMALISEIETHLKILDNIKDSIRELKQSNLQPDSPKSGAQFSSGPTDCWDLSGILNQVKPEFREEILNDPKKQQTFIAWLIQSSLNGRVNRPLNLALAKTLQEKTPPDAAARRLAELTKSQLVGLLEQALSEPASLGYQKNPKLRSRITDLQLLLMGEDARSQALLLQRLMDLLL